MTTPRTATSHYEWKLSDAKLQLATQTPLVTVLGPQTHRTIPKGLLLNFAPKWRWHLNPSSACTICIQDLPHPQLNFVLDWMLVGGDNYSGPSDLPVPNADIATMNLLLGFVEALEAKPLAYRVREFRNGMLFGYTQEEQAYRGYQENRNKFSIASVEDTVEMYLSGVRSSVCVTSTAGDITTTADLPDNGSIVEANKEGNKASGQQYSTEKDTDGNVDSEKVMRKNTAERLSSATCTSRAKSLVTKILAAEEAEEDQAEKERAREELTAKMLESEEEGYLTTEEFGAVKELATEEPAARYLTMEALMADNLAEQLAAEQPSAEYCAAEELVAEMLAADVLAADLAEEEQMASDRFVVQDLASELLAINTHNRLNPNRKIETPSSNYLDLQASRQKKVPFSETDSRGAAGEKTSEEELKKAIALSIENESTIYHHSPDSPITEFEFRSSHGTEVGQERQELRKGKGSKLQDGQSSRKTIKAEAVPRRGGGGGGGGEFEDQSSTSDNAQDIVIGMEREGRQAGHDVSEVVGEVEEGGGGGGHTISGNADGTEDVIIRLDQQSRLAASSPSGRGVGSTAAAAYQDSITAEVRAGSIEDWCIRDDGDDDDDNSRSSTLTPDARYEMTGAQQSVDEALGPEPFGH